MKHVAKYNECENAVTYWDVDPEVRIASDRASQPIAQGRAPSMESARACVAAIAEVLCLDMLQ